MNPSWADYHSVLGDLGKLSHEPLLIGRMAMVVFGSDQLTHDMDLVAPDFPEVINILYAHGFQIISDKKSGLDGAVSYEVYNNATQAKYAIGLRNKKAFRSVHAETGAELDIWLEPPVSYDELLEGSRKVKLKGLKLRVPSKENMIRLKKIAIADNPLRKSKDQWDIDFLRALPE